MTMADEPEDPTNTDDDLEGPTVPNEPPPVDEEDPGPPEPPPPAPKGRPDRHLRAVGAASGHRAPPHNEEAEQSLLGAMLTRAEVIGAVVEFGLPSQAFYRPSHAAIFATIEGLYTSGRPADPVTIREAMTAQGTQDAIGDKGEYLLHLIGTTPRTENVTAYAEIILATWRLRQGIGHAGEAAEAFYARNPSQALAALQRALEIEETTNHQLHSWQPIDLGAVLSGEVEDPPTMLERDDGQALIYPGKVHSFNAESESGKSMLAVHLCLERMHRGEHVLYVDFEDSAKSVVGRVLAMGATDAMVVELFHYIRPDDPIDLSAQAHLSRVIANHSPTLAIIDGVTEVMTMNGWSLLDNAEIAQFQRALPNRLADKGLAVVLIDHVPKDKDGRGKGGLGGQHKRAGIDVGYNLEVIKPFGRGLDGLVRLTCDKDRPGYVRAASEGGSHTADVHIVSADLDGELQVSVESPRIRIEDTSTWEGPTECMAAVEHLLEQHPGEWMSKAQLHRSLQVALGRGWREKVVGQACEHLAGQGRLLSKTRGRAHLYAALPAVPDSPEGIDDHFEF